MRSTMILRVNLRNLLGLSEIKARTLDEQSLHNFKCFFIILLSLHHISPPPYVALNIVWVVVNQLLQDTLSKPNFLRFCEVNFSPSQIAQIVIRML